jgi:hypothetical protein
MQISHRIMTMMMALALFVAIGGPLAALQGVAWVNMVHDFSKTGSLSQAVEKTFDGQHLCTLCQKLAKARAAEEKAPVTMKVDKKAEFFIASGVAIAPLPSVCSFAYPPHPLVNVPEHLSAPPVPVPISALIS